jgi:hypothetical protein
VIGGKGLGIDLGEYQDEHGRGQSCQQGRLVPVLGHNGQKKERSHRGGRDIDESVADEDGRQQLVNPGEHPLDQPGPAGAFLFQDVQGIGVQRQEGGLGGGKKSA